MAPIEAPRTLASPAEIAPQLAAHAPVLTAPDSDYDLLLTLTLILTLVFDFELDVKW